MLKSPHLSTSMKTISEAMLLGEAGFESFLEARSLTTTDQEIEEYLTLLRISFVRSGNTTNLKKAIQRAQKWVSDTPTEHGDHRKRCQIVKTFSDCLEAYEKDGVTIDRAGSMGVRRGTISKCKMFLTKAMYQSAESRLKQYDGDGDKDHLLQAIYEAEASIDTLGPMISSVLSMKVAAIYHEVYHRTADISHLAMSVTHAAIGALGFHEEFTRRYVFLIQLAGHLITLFCRDGDVDFVNEAVRILHHVVRTEGEQRRLLDENPSAYADILGRLGRALSLRSFRLGSSDDLSSSIEFTNQALDLAKPEDPGRSKLLADLSMSYCHRYRRYSAKEDIDLAIQHREASIALESTGSTPTVDDERKFSASALSELLLHRYLLIHDPEDISRGIEAARIGAENFATLHPDRSMCFIMYSIWMKHKYQSNGSVEDLHIGVEFAQKALSAVYQRSANYANWQAHLGELYGLKFRLTQAVEDSKAQLETLLQAWKTANNTSSHPHVRFDIAKQVALLLAQNDERQDWQLGCSILADAVTSMHDDAILSMHHSDKEWAVKKYAGLASEAAAFSLNAGKSASEALKILDHGRGLIGGGLNSLRGDVSLLAQKRPDLGNKLRAVWTKIEQSLSSAQADNFSTRQFMQEVDTSDVLQQIVAEIRTVEGFESFQQPLAEDDFQLLAQKGPIVVLSMSKVRDCDAFLVSRTGVEVLALPGITKRVVEYYIAHLAHPTRQVWVLDWLWHAICEPCLKKLGFTTPVADGNWPRVWWIPCGQLTAFPFHAAACQERTDSDSVINRVISSYATSLKALHYQRTLKSTYSESKNAVLVDMPSTPGHAALAFVSEEVKLLQPICESMGFEVSTSRRLKSDVLKNLKGSAIFHFAGHGKVDMAEPSKSSILLDDWENGLLTVADIRNLKLHEDPPFLAYLSACSTGVVRETELADEGIHLASAFQLAGFRHVISTLWSVDDHSCVEVAKIVYQTIQARGSSLSGEAVGEGLHHALRSLRENSTPTNQKLQDNNATPCKEPVKEPFKDVRPQSQTSTDCKKMREQVLLDDESDSVDGPTNLLWVPFLHFGP